MQRTGPTCHVRAVGSEVKSRRMPASPAVSATSGLNAPPGTDATVGTVVQDVTEHLSAVCPLTAQLLRAARGHLQRVCHGVAADDVAAAVQFLDAAGSRNSECRAGRAS